MILNVEKLTVELSGTRVLEDISFSVAKGEYICIVGENGSGKSTLVKAILNQVPVKSGTVTFASDAGKIGYLPQQSAISRDFPASCREVVLSGCLNRLGKKPFFTAALKAEAEKNMKSMNITDLAKRPFSVLSGGQRQRVLLARAICACENMIVLDEPVTGLDPIATDEMYRLISARNREDGTTVLMVSHDIPAAVKYATKILHIGTTVRFFGSTDEYLKTELGIHFTGRCCEHV